MFPTTPGFELRDVPGSLPPDNVPADVDISIVEEHTRRLLLGLTGASLVRDALWRDCMAMFPTIRTIASAEKITRLWNERKSVRQVTSIQIVPGGMVVKPLPNTSWVMVSFKMNPLQGGIIGIASGTASLVLEDGTWKIWQLVTLLEQFDGLRSPDDMKLKDVVRKEDVRPGVRAKLDTQIDYFVAIIGAGQQGLSLAGRLSAVGVDYALFERNESIGENWTSRYKSMTLHTPKAMNNLPGDPTWVSDDPEFLHAEDVARGYRNYVTKYEINLQLATQLVEANWDARNEIWTLRLQKKGQTIISVYRCKHFVLAVGGSYTIPKMPSLENAQGFRGTVMHSSRYTDASDWIGKKGVVVGAGVSGHDIAQDMLDKGLSSVTMIQRGPTPVAPNKWALKVLSVFYNDHVPSSISDRMGAGPFKIATEMCRQAVLLEAAKAPQFWDDLEKAGFLVDRRADLFNAAFVTMKSYYPDIGTSAHIVAGNIKVASGVTPVSFTERGMKLSDGREIEADLVVFATGFVRDYREYATRFIGAELISQCVEQLGLDEDGEIRGLYDMVGPNLWSLAGAGYQARWNTRFIAMKLQIEYLGEKLN